MADTKISDSVIYIGADDHDIDLFESQYVVPNGVSYNSYVIIDEKIAVMDTADPRVTDVWFDNLERLWAAESLIILLFSTWSLTMQETSKNLRRNILK